jgi:hypothetical protein
VQDTDIGSAIDKLIKANILSTDDPIALYYPKLGQFWCINGATCGLQLSAARRRSAWSKFTFPFSIDDACVLNQELYVRTGNDVYKVSTRPDEGRRELDPAGRYPDVLPGRQAPGRAESSSPAWT